MKLWVGTILLTSALIIGYTLMYPDAPDWARGLLVFIVAPIIGMLTSLGERR